MGWGTRLLYSWSRAPDPTLSRGGVRGLGHETTVQLVSCPRPHPLMRRNGRRAWAGARDYCTVSLVPQTPPSHEEACVGWGTRLLYSWSRAPDPTLSRGGVRGLGHETTVQLVSCPRPHPLTRRRAWAGARDYYTVCCISMGMATTLIVPTFNFTLMDSIQNFYGMMTYKHEVNMHLHKDLW